MILSSACWPVKGYGLTSKGVQVPSFEVCQRPIRFRRFSVQTFRNCALHSWVTISIFHVVITNFNLNRMSATLHFLNLKFCIILFSLVSCIWGAPKIWTSSCWRFAKKFCSQRFAMDQVAVMTTIT